MKTISVSVFGAKPDPATLDQYRAAGINRVVLPLPSEGRDHPAAARPVRRAPPGWPASRSGCVVFNCVVAGLWRETTGLIARREKSSQVQTDPWKL